MVGFGGWEMPVQYAGISLEHRAVRERAGLFDISHMGEIELTGPSALGALQQIVTNDVSRLAAGDALYTVMCRPDGGIVDDVIVSRLAAERFLVCVNASNEAKNEAWIREYAGDATLTNRSDATALLALQGPAAEAVLSRITDVSLVGRKPFTVVEGAVAGATAWISRTGYTGEDGFEIYLPAEQAVPVWSAILKAGAPEEIAPVGLGARDTLRLERALMLYGNDIDAGTTPLEAGLGWTVKPAKGDFLGRAALERQRRDGLRRRLVGIGMEDNSIPRHGYSVWVGELEVGRVTSGTKSPTLRRGIALAYVSIDAAAVGSALEIEIRGKRHPARVEPLPFYRRLTTV